MAQRKDSLCPWQPSLSYIRSGHALVVGPHRALPATQQTRLKLCYNFRPRLPRTKSRLAPSSCLRSETRKETVAKHCIDDKPDLPSPPSSMSFEPSTADVDVGLLSPMMQHYVFTKRAVGESLDIATLKSPPNRNFILMYRVGDFFESFFEDARVLSKVCEIALTSKDAGKALGNRVPMAGVPHHCIDEKIRMLLDNNVTVAVVDQVQSAASVPSGKLVERAVTRLITPGTACDESLLDGRVSSYLASIAVKPSAVLNPPIDAEEQDTNRNLNISFGFSYADVSTGEFMATEACGMDALRRLLITVSPSEVLLVVPLALEKAAVAIEEEIKNAGVGVVSRRELLPLETSQNVLSRFHDIDNVESIGCREKPLCTQAAAVLLTFIEKTIGFENKTNDSLLLNKLLTFSLSNNMLLDGACLKNLEVLETVRDGIKDRSLQWAVDRTTTVMGARCLRAWLVSPPLSLETILQRQKIVESFVKDNGTTATELQRALRRVSDLERLGGRLILRRTTPRELQCLCESILLIPSVINIVRSCIEEQMPREVKSHSIQSLLAPVDSKLLALSQKVLGALVDPAPASVPSDVSIMGSATREGFTISGTQIFRAGYSLVLDELREQLGRPEGWITTIENKEKTRTSIDTLRVKHIKNVGYVVRVPRSTGEKIMNEDPMFFKRLGYEQVQSTKVELRFRFEDLRTNEKEFHAGFSQILTLELDMYEELRNKMRGHVRYMRSLGSRIARMDVLAGLAMVALEQHYVKPILVPQSHRVLELVDIRHPVVEQTMPSGKTYVPNSFRLGQTEGNAQPDLMILCGPNAAGKSCSLRSVGLVAILAQIGSFVPARWAKLSICDRIFTRVGAVDDVSRGQSTFQVEMAETSCILSHATSSSLVLLDEIGRGTSAVDGIAIAWSVSEFLARRTSGDAQPPRSMFVTHYHELNHLSELYGNVQSFHLHVEQIPSRTDERSIGDDHGWVATYSIVPGPSYESCGIAIARRAGLPRPVIERAYKIANLLRVPSQNMGSELRRGLMQDAETDDKLLRRYSGTDSVTDQINARDGIYRSGFEDGYRKALKEVCTNFEDVMERLGSQQDHRQSFKPERFNGAKDAPALEAQRDERQLL